MLNYNLPDWAYGNSFEEERQMIINDVRSPLDKSFIVKQAQNRAFESSVSRTMTALPEYLLIFLHDLAKHCNFKKASMFVFTSGYDFLETEMLQRNIPYISITELRERIIFMKNELGDKAVGMDSLILNNLTLAKINRPGEAVDEQVVYLPKVVVTRNDELKNLFRLSKKDIIRLIADLSIVHMYEPKGILADNLDIKVHTNRITEAKKDLELIFATIRENLIHSKKICGQLIRMCFQEDPASKREKTDKMNSLLAQIGDIRCPHCLSDKHRKNGKRNSKQRYEC